MRLWPDPGRKRIIGVLFRPRNVSDGGECRFTTVKRNLKIEVDMVIAESTCVLLCCHSLNSA